jgi:exodeoxyribonuclease V beta subunit
VYALDPCRSASQGKQPKSDPDRSALDAMVARLLAQDLAQTMPQVAWQGDGWPQGLAALAPENEGAEPRSALAQPPVAPLRQRLSFSTLVGGHRAAPTEEAAADDELAGERLATDVAAQEPPHPQLQALAGVRGPAFGNALHAAFEHRRHELPLAAQPALLQRELDAFGVRPRDLAMEALVPELAGRMDGALAAVLLPGLSLGGVPPRRQRAEMAFHFHLDAARLSQLRAACAAHGDPDLVPALASERLRGLMTGKIDLVFEHAGRFHVLDYKGNWLGERVSDYTGAALRAAMDHSHYRLQALLYTLAVHRFLRQRVPGYSPAVHLGEYFYLFVRAAGLAPGAGVFSERFPDALVAAVDAALSETEAQA